MLCVLLCVPLVNAEIMENAWVSFLVYCGSILVRTKVF